MDPDRPPRVVLVALAVAVLGLLVNQAASIGWLVVLAETFTVVPSPTSDDPFATVNAASGVGGALGGAAFGLAVWGAVGWGLWRGQRWGRAAATVLMVPAVLYALAPLVALPLARRVLAAMPAPWDRIELPGLGSYPVVLGVVGAALVATAVTLLWLPAAGAWFRRDLTRAGAASPAADGRSATRP